MAGSYQHCVDGTPEKFTFDLIENMGDAHEACYEMFWMIHWLAGGSVKRIQEAEDAFYAACRKQSGTDFPPIERL